MTSEQKRQWRKAIKNGTNEVLKRLVNDLIAPVESEIKRDEGGKYGDT